MLLFTLKHRKCFDTPIGLQRRGLKIGCVWQSYDTLNRDATNFQIVTITQVCIAIGQAEQDEDTVSQKQLVIGTPHCKDEYCHEQNNAHIASICNRIDSL